MANAGLVQDLGTVPEHALSELLNKAVVGDGDTALQSLESFRSTKMPRRVRAASIASNTMPGELEHTVVPSGLIFREKLASKPIGPPIHWWSMVATLNPR